VILSFKELASARPTEWAMVDGCFDPLHEGHLRYFEAAKELGLPLLCNVQGDSYIEQAKKRPTILPESQRAYLLHSLRVIDFVHICKSSTAEVLRVAAPKFYVKGPDWKDRGLPAEEVAVCKEVGTSIVFLQTPTDSSTGLSKKYFEGMQRLGT
jgi:cytidyltransferase-like protein